MNTKGLGPLIEALRFERRKSFDPVLTQGLLAGAISKTLGRRVPRTTYTRWAYGATAQIPEDAAVALLNFFGVTELELRARNGRPESSGNLGGKAAHGGGAPRTQVTMLHTPAKEPWNSNSMRRSVEHVHDLLGPHRAFFSIEDEDLLVAGIFPADVLVFEPTTSVTYGAVNRLTNRANPELSVLREIRRSGDEVEFFTPVPDSERVGLLEWAVVGRLVACARKPNPLYALVNEDGLSFADLRALR